ncbi:HK97 family phage prohead protease [Escherichia coli]|nr:HK97 family phage prohead protease [Escherichia coli]
MKLILPFPPSVNTYWRHPNKGAFAGKSLISAAGRKFQSAACAAIVEQLRRLPKPTSAPASVEIVLFPPDNRIRDLDNYNKALFDALTHAGVWEDDSQVKRMLVEWGPVVGLYVRGRLLIDDDPLAKRAHAHMKAGSLTGLSIGYVLKDWEYDRSKEAFLLKEIDLWEVSLVTFPSNDEARISDVKNALSRGEIPEQKKIERVLRDVGLSRTQAKAFMAGGYGALSLRDAEDVGSALNALKNLNF